MAMTLRQIEIFVEAAIDQNFRKTSDRLDISQPAISRHIQLLERHVGGKLFIRERGSHAQLSPLGRTMLIEARAMLRAARKVGQGNETDAQETTVRIAAGNYLLDRWIRPQVRQLFGEEEGLNLEFVQAAEHEELLRLLGAGEVDCAFYTGNPMDLPGLDFHPLRETSIGIYVSPQMARGVQRVPQDVAGLPFILSNKDTPSEAWQRATLKGLSIEPARVAARSQFMEIIIDHVIGGRGAGLLFDDDAWPFVEEGKLVRLPLDFPSGQRIMVTRSSAAPAPRKQRVIREICRLLEGG
jgi:LysR family transcriptional regulator, low CO2-responsive transcriptional regulator